VHKCVVNDRLYVYHASVGGDAHIAPCGKFVTCHGRADVGIGPYGYVFDNPINDQLSFICIASDCLASITVEALSNCMIWLAYNPLWPDSTKQTTQTRANK